ncbi:MAG: putative tellurite resistance protein B-like protein [Oceanicoccus sp.]
MLAKIKLFFSQELSLSDKKNANDEEQESALQLAAAALLIELSRADYQQDRSEQISIENALQECFKLEPAQLEQLISLAEEENKDATSLYQFTSLIKDNYSSEQRFKLVKMLWQVALADGEISKYEDHLIRKVADLIYLSHSQFIKAKLDVIG